MADADINKATSPVSLYDENTGLSAAIELIDAAASLRTFGVQAIESLKGFDNFSDCWFYIGTEADSKGAGLAGDTVTVTIGAGDDVVKFPAVSVTSTLTATEESDETALATLIASDLNSDSNFNKNFFARRVDAECSLVHITAKFPGAQGERPKTSPADFQVSSTGTTVVTAAQQNIVRRNKTVSLARDPSDPRVGILGISGTVSQAEGSVTGRITEFASNGGSSSLLVNGSVTPVDFTINASPDKERFFTSLRFEALGNGIQFTKFLSQNTSLTNGLLITIRSNDSQIDLPAIKATEDFASYFSRGPSDFDVFDVSGTDYFRATLTFPAPFQLYKQNTFLQNDFIRVQVRDSLLAGITRLQFIGFGFERDF